MKKKFLLYIMDDESVLYNEAAEKLLTLKKNIEEAQTEIKNFLFSTPKVPLRLLIDRSLQDIHEEKLPFLLPWDKIRLLFHKRAEWRAKGGYSDAHFFKHDRETYFRWVHISQNDLLSSWVSWGQSLPNPWGGIFFVPFEARNFLKNFLPTSKDYQLLLYSLPSYKTRHVVFKGKRLLLSRLSQGTEDLRASLHFLSRTHPDIHEKLHVLNLIPGVSLPLPQLTTLSDPHSLLKSLSIQKRTSFSFDFVSPPKVLWLRRGRSIFLIFTIFFAGFNIYQALNFKNKALCLSTEIERLTIRTKNLSLLLKRKNIPFLRHALEHYHSLDSQKTTPLKTFESLSILLQQHQLHLESLKWYQEENTKMILTFLMKGKAGKILSSKFNAFLISCANLFPKAQIQVIEAPFNSSIHEVFKNPSDLSSPLAKIKIVLP